jgi:hypothetical protein
MASLRDERGNESDGRRGRKTAKRILLESVLLAGIVIVSALAIAWLAPGSGTPGQGSNQPPPPVVNPPPELNGTGDLVVSIAVNAFSSPPGSNQSSPATTFLPSQVELLATAASSGAVFPFRMTFVIPQPGRMEIPLGTGNYSIAINGVYYNVSTGVQIQQGKITTLNLNVSSMTFRPATAYLEDVDGAGVIHPWETLAYLIDPGSTTFFRGETVFLQGSFQCCTGQPITISGLNFTTAGVVKVFLDRPFAARVASTEAASDGTWLNVSPVAPLYYSSVSSTWPVVISTTYLVSHG